MFGVEFGELRGHLVDERRVAVPDVLVVEGRDVDTYLLAGGRARRDHGLTEILVRVHPAGAGSDDFVGTCGADARDHDRVGTFGDDDAGLAA